MWCRYHLVARLIPSEADSWSDDEVLERWTCLYRGPLLVQRYRDGETLTEPELSTLRSIVAVFRRRLTSLSWFMKCLNEPIARRANREDQCTGHFWEARFHSQALCTDRALIAAMAYVDLNPIRAGIARQPERSEYTSIRCRIRNNGNRPVSTDILEDLPKTVRIRPLSAFAESKSGRNLPIRRSDYLELVDVTGRVAVSGKAGRIDPALAPILERLDLSPGTWTNASLAFNKHFRAGDLRIAS